MQQHLPHLAHSLPPHHLIAVHSRLAPPLTARWAPRHARLLPSAARGDRIAAPRPPGSAHAPNRPCAGIPARGPRRPSTAAIRRRRRAAPPRRARSPRPAVADPRWAVGRRECDRVAAPPNWNPFRDALDVRADRAGSPLQ
eukprot:ctg_1865.g531